MSDNPNGPELINLGVEDDGSLDAIIARFQANIQNLASSSEEAFTISQQAAQSFSDTIDQLASIFQADGVDTESEKIRALTEATVAASDAMKQAVQNADDLNAAFANGGNFGGDDGSGGGGGGSLFGVAHGIRAASGLGRMAGLGTGGTEALTGVADLLYLEQGMQKLSGVITGLGISFETLFTIAGPVVGVVAIVAAVMADLAEKAKTATEAEKAYGEAIKAAIPTALGGGQTDVQAGIAKASQDITVQLAEKEAALNEVRRMSLEHGGLLATQIASLTNDQIEHSGLLQKTYAELFKSVDTANQAIAKDKDVVDLLTQSINSQTEAANTAAEAARKKATEDIAAAAQYASDDTATTKSLLDRRDKLQAENIQIEKSVALIEASSRNEALSAEQRQKNNTAIAALNDTYDKNYSEIQHITDASLELADARTKEAAAIKAADEATKDHEATLKKITDAQVAYDKAIQKSLETFTNSANDLALKEKVSEQQYQPGSTQDTFARQTIALKEQTDVAKIEEDTANKIEDIRTKLGETEARIITDYNRQLFDDQIKAQDSIQKAQIDAQRTAVEDQISYQERIADIERSAHINEQQALLDRNFLQITKDELNKNNQIQTETDHYNDQEEKLQRHLANQEQDIQRNLEITEAQQQTAEQRKLADAETAADNSITQEQTTEKRKIEVAQDAQQKALADLSRNEIEKLTLMRESWYQQWSMLGLQENQREQLAAQTEQQIVSQNEQILAAGTNAFIDDLNRLNAMASGSSGGSSVPAPSMWQTLNGGGDIATFAGGGDFQAGQPFMMSEAGIPEFLNIGSDSFAMNAPALVYPLQSGSVTNAGGGGGKNITYAPTYNIPQGMKTPDIVSLIEQHNATFMQELTR